MVNIIIVYKGTSLLYLDGKFRVDIAHSYSKVWELYKGLPETYHSRHLARLLSTPDLKLTSVRLSKPKNPVASTKQRKTCLISPK